MKVSMIGSEFPTFTSGAVAVAFSAVDFANNGGGSVNLTIGALSFRLDVTAGSFAQNAIYLNLALGGTRLFETSAQCVPGVSSSSPLTGNIFGPKGGGYLLLVSWDGINGTVSGGWTLPK